MAATAPTSMSAAAWRAFDATRFANPSTSKLRAYDPGHDLPALRERFGAAIAELGSNENPIGPSPRAIEAIRSALAGIHRYPDPRGLALKRALATRFEIGIERIALGNGSHELLMLIAQCFADPAHSIVHSEFGFAVFPIATAAAGAQAIRARALPRMHPTAPLGHDLDAIAAAVRDDTRIVYLANPNNPTGTWFDDAALERFVARIPDDVLIVVDEAYHEYAETPELQGALALSGHHPNVMITRTFSKAHALAGLRVGYLIAHPSVVAVVERLRESFNVNAPALAAAEAALGDRDHVGRARRFNDDERARLSAGLAARGYRVLPSRTNFVLVDLGRDAAALERHLFERGVIVRPMGGYGLAETIRVSIGSIEENTRLLDALP